MRMNEKIFLNSIKKPFDNKDFIFRVIFPKSIKSFLSLLFLWSSLELVFDLYCNNRYIADTVGFFIFPFMIIITAIITKAHNLEKNFKKIVLPLLISGFTFWLLHFLITILFPSNFLNQFICLSSRHIKIFSLDLYLGSGNIFFGQLSGYLSFFQTIYLLSLFGMIANFYIKLYKILEQKEIIKKELKDATKVISITFLCLMPLSGVILILLAPENHIANIFFNAVFIRNSSGGLSFLFSIVSLSELNALLEIEKSA